MTFEEMRLVPPIQRALVEEQYQVPTPVQAQTIPAALDGRDILGSAQTGTGKTAAFALPILNRMSNQARKPIPYTPAVLILAPTRELAIQIGDSLTTYGRHLRVKHTLVYGGVGQHKQVRDLQRGVHILVATPGRLLDLMNQGYIELDQLEVFVLDEADRMLDMGFLPDIKRIMRELPEERQSLFFSATLPPKIIELSQQLLTDPVQVHVEPELTTVAAIEQQLILVDAGHKKALLARILKSGEVGQSVVFTKTKRGSSNVASFLQKQGIAAIEIHGNKSQNARQRALDAFRRSDVQVLVATDVAARGIDVDGISHVFNLDLPIEPENYVHRIGRTGRAGATGVAISFCSPADRNLLRAVEKEIGQKIPLAPNQPKRTDFSADDRELSSANVEERPDYRRKARPEQERGPRRESAQADGRRPAPPHQRTNSRDGKPRQEGGGRRESSQQQPSGHRDQRPQRADQPRRSEGSEHSADRTSRGERSAVSEHRRPHRSEGRSTEGRGTPERRRDEAPRDDRSRRPASPRSSESRDRQGPSRDDRRPPRDGSGRDQREPQREYARRDEHSQSERKHSGDRTHSRAPQSKQQGTRRPRSGNS